MEGASGAFAVVSLAIQLLGTIQQTVKFVKDINNAPSELIRLGETLDQLGSVLGYVKQLLEHQLWVLRLPGTPIFILDALQKCERSMKPLEEILDKAKQNTNKRDLGVRRKWNSLQLVMKKEQLQELRLQLGEAKSGLESAVSVNSWQLIMHHIQITQKDTVEDAKLAETKSSDKASHCETTRSGHLGLGHGAIMPSSQRPSIREETSREIYNGVFGSVRVSRKTRRLGDFGGSGSQQVGPVINEDIVTIRPSFLRQSIEMCFSNTFGRISRSLNMYPVVQRNDPVFIMCERGDMNGLQVAFSSGGVSPFVLDECGETLLHHAALYFRSELCSWLLQLGVDPNRSTDYEHTALQRVCIPGVCDEYGSDLTLFEKPIVDTLRVLSQAQEEFTLSDVADFTLWYQGPPAGADFLLLQRNSLAGIMEDDRSWESAYYFAMAVSLYGKGCQSWETLIRRLIWEGIDIYGSVNWLCTMPWSDGVDGDSPGDMFYYPSTPLDELFRYTKTPFEAKTVASVWLQLLSNEGFNILDYLEKEMSLHAKQERLTNATFYCRRKLVFQLGEFPGVWWDWQLDPDSGAFLVREEYKLLNFIGSQDSCYDFQDTLEGDPWPWGRFDCIQEGRTMIFGPIPDLPGPRFNRRMAKKALKAARAQGIKKPSMPGTWPI